MKREINFKPEKKIAQRYVKDLMPFPPPCQTQRGGGTRRNRTSNTDTSNPPEKCVQQHRDVGEKERKAREGQRECERGL